MCRRGLNWKGSQRRRDQLRSCGSAVWHGDRGQHCRVLFPTTATTADPRCSHHWEVNVFVSVLCHGDHVTAEVTSSQLHTVVHVNYINKTGRIRRKKPVRWSEWNILRGSPRVDTGPGEGEEASEGFLLWDWGTASAFVTVRPFLASAFCHGLWQHGRFPQCLVGTDCLTPPRQARVLRARSQALHNERPPSPAGVHHPSPGSQSRKRKQEEVRERVRSHTAPGGRARIRMQCHTESVSWPR